ncbi:hypothetical protein [Zhihengliuella salsuginis]|uniref:Uncharacterized protein n=1 Tax=Zhihengliuella salsuginis TaxID=578222 RepID=A0ABQ3GH50_9MICC|nr:hypothetical protein [Zhihengliuella salsuginis]GHD06129.1 hypothetical protein GCM10008096_15730 [Zhihengliuella salsuginis]
MTESAPTHTGFTGALSFVPVEGWQPEHAREELELLAVFPDAPFAPSLTATVIPFAGDIHAFAARALDGLNSTLKDFRLVNVTGWQPDLDALEAHAADPELENPESLRRRRIEYVHRAPDGQLISGADYLFIDQGWAVQVTTTCAIADRLLHHDAFESMVGNVSVLRPAGAAPASASPATIEYDDVASAAFGANVESLAGWADQPPLQREGEFIHAATLMQVEQLDSENPVNLGRNIFRPTGLTNDVIANMQWLQLLDDELRPTALGRFFHQAMGNADINVQATAHLADGAESLLQIGIVGETALVIAQPGCAELHGGAVWGPPGPDHYWAEILPTIEVSQRILEWAGATPAWNLQIQPDALPAATIDAKVSGEAASTQVGANAAAQRLWDQKWWRWSVQMESEGLHIDPLEYVSAGAAGPHAVLPGPTPDTRLLSPTPAHLVFWQIEERLQAVTYKRDSMI